jgi:hypothetical protein
VAQCKGVGADTDYEGRRLCMVTFAPSFYRFLLREQMWTYVWVLAIFAFAVAAGSGSATDVCQEKDECVRNTTRVWVSGVGSVKIPRVFLLRSICIYTL